MARSLLTLFLSVALICNTACSDEDEKRIYDPASGDYLPLQIGNEWTFKSNNLPYGLIQRKVDSKKTIGDHEYFLLITSNTCTTCNSVADSLYMRIDESNGYVYSRRPKSTWEDNWFRLDAQDKDTWSYTVDIDDTAVITVSEVQVTLGNTIVPKSKAYYYDVEQWADEEYTRSLAKGVGFVEEYSNAWGGRYTLTSVRIGGKTLYF